MKSEIIRGVTTVRLDLSVNEFWELRASVAHYIGKGMSEPHTHLRAVDVALKELSAKLSMERE